MVKRPFCGVWTLDLYGLYGFGVCGIYSVFGVVAVSV